MQSGREIKDQGYLALTVASVTTVSVVATVLCGYYGVSVAIQIAVFAVSGVLVFAVLLRLYQLTKRSKYAEQLYAARLHIALHAVPAVFFGVYLSDEFSPYVNVVIIVLLFLFFASGRAAWRKFRGLFGSSRLYVIFFYGNSAFMRAFPALYCVSLAFEDAVSFTFIVRLALFYFTVHFSILGASALKIESDLG